MAKKDRLLVSEDVVIEEGSKPEVYTEEHEKLLGSTERSWTLFVDGYGADGKRIYDPINGKTCHQCRSVRCLNLFSLCQYVRVQVAVSEYLLLSEKVRVVHASSICFLLIQSYDIFIKPSV